MFNWISITLFGNRSYFVRYWLKLDEFWIHVTDGLCMDNVETCVSYGTPTSNISWVCACDLRRVTNNSVDIRPPTKRAIAESWT